MNRIDIINKLKKIFLEVTEIGLKFEELDESNDNLFEGYGVNSIVALEYLITVEDEFDIEIDGEYLDSRLVNNIPYLADYIIKAMEKNHYD